MPTYSDKLLEYLVREELEYSIRQENYIFRYFPELLTAEEKSILDAKVIFEPTYPLLRENNANAHSCGYTKFFDAKKIAFIEKKYRLSNISMGQADSYEQCCLPDWLGHFGQFNPNFRSKNMEIKFRESCIKRIISEHYMEIYEDSCKCCNKLKRTPKAKKCMWCIKYTTGDDLAKKLFICYGVKR